MSIQIRLPNITAQKTEDKISQLSSYLYQLVGQLNWALNLGTDTSSSSASKNVTTQQGSSGMAYVSSDILEYATGCRVGITPVCAEEGTVNLPDDTYAHALGTVLKASESSASIQLISPTGSTAVNVYDGTAWCGWQTTTS